MLLDCLVTLELLRRWSFQEKTAVRGWRSYCRQIDGTGWEGWGSHQHCCWNCPSSTIWLWLCFKRDSEPSKLWNWWEAWKQYGTRFLDLGKGCLWLSCAAVSNQSCTPSISLTMVPIFTAFESFLSTVSQTISQNTSHCIKGSAPNVARGRKQWRSCGVLGKCALTTWSVWSPA